MFFYYLFSRGTKKKKTKKRNGHQLSETIPNDSSLTSSKIDKKLLIKQSSVFTLLLSMAMMLSCRARSFTLERVSIIQFNNDSSSAIDGTSAGLTLLAYCCPSLECRAINRRCHCIIIHIIRVSLNCVYIYLNPPSYLASEEVVVVVG